MTVTLLGFSTEPGFDFLYVFAGATTRSPLIGQLTGAFADLVTRAFSSQEGLAPYCSRMTMPVCALSAVCVCLRVHECALPSQLTLHVHGPSASVYCVQPSPSASLQTMEQCLQGLWPPSGPTRPPWLWYHCESALLPACILLSGRSESFLHANFPLSCPCCFPLVVLGVALLSGREFSEPFLVQKYGAFVAVAGTAQDGTGSDNQVLQLHNSDDTPLMLTFSSMDPMASVNVVDAISGAWLASLTGSAPESERTVLSQSATGTALCT